ESLEPAQTAPHFWIAPGSFAIDGLWVERSAPGRYPGAAFPAAEPAASTSAGARWVAFLELHERVITAAEDPGVREQALGGQLDTTLRPEVVGQVKLAPVTGGLSPAAIRDAFETLVLPSGTLIVDTASATPDPNPCALPITGGFTGRSNR